MSSEPWTRDQFPALKDQVYLDNASGSQILGSAIDAIKDNLSTNSYNVERESTALEEARRAAARHMGAGVDEVVFGPSATQLLRNLSYSLKFEPGNEIIISNSDHEANIAPWLDLAKREDLVVRWWKPQDPTGSQPKNPKLFMGDLQYLLNGNTRLVVCTHVSNILGTIHNITEFSRIVHGYDALICVDGVAYAPHRPLDVKEWGVDFYVFSWAKVFGPHIATLYASWQAQMRMKSLGHSFNPTASLEQKLGLSAGCYELCHAVPRIVEYLGAPGKWEAIKAHEKALTKEIFDVLKRHHRDHAVKVYGEKQFRPGLRVSTISFNIKGWDSQAVVESIQREKNLGIGWGTFGSDRLVRETLGLGPSGVVRVSLVHYNTRKSLQGHEIPMQS